MRVIYEPHQGMYLILIEEPENVNMNQETLE